MRFYVDAVEAADAVIETYRVGKADRALSALLGVQALILLATGQYPLIDLAVEVNVHGGQPQLMIVPFNRGFQLDSVVRDITDSDVAGLTELWPRILAGFENRRIAIALRRVVAVHERNTIDDGFIDAWIALEALFGSDTEIAHRISQRIAYYTGSDPDERMATYDESKALYTLRSKLVHGAPATISRDQFESAFNLMMKALTMILRSEGRAFDPTGLDTEMLRGSAFRH